ncbi:MNIO family bufferin maturase [Algicola sagamiensis]|uniref:MNIO family bufferin maturase n=1 Tax=Algicola sagamiensis TaxID=163869 RepID=UPI0003606039|nr:DUF692 domain-containing protein [Algicola sagamiensis]
MAARNIKGAGLGLRPLHLHEVLQEQPDVPWFEVHICNYLGGGLNPFLLSQINEIYPFSFHGVSLNLGGVDVLDFDYLSDLKQAINTYQPVLVSEHACFTAHDGHFFHDLLPVPFTDEAVQHMANRIKVVQDFLGRQILIENVSRYATYAESQLSEGEFLAAVSREADCGLLLDLNNAYVNQHNLGESVDTFLLEIPVERVAEIHLAGYSVKEDRLLDTHSAEVTHEVWEVFEKYCEQCPMVPCLIEWDSKLPSFDVLMSQMRKAQAYMDFRAYQPTAEGQSCLVMPV